MSDKTWDDPRITAYVLGDLPDEQRVDFESELESDPELAAAVEEVRSLTGQLEQLYADEPTETLDAERRREIAAGQIQLNPGPAEPSSSRFLWVALATAACVLILVGVAPYLRSSQQPVTFNEATPPPSEMGAIEMGDTESGSDDFSAPSGGRANVQLAEGEPRSLSVNESTTVDSYDAGLPVTVKDHPFAVDSEQVATHEVAVTHGQPTRDASETKLFADLDEAEADELESLAKATQSVIRQQQSMQQQQAAESQRRRVAQLEAEATRMLRRRAATPAPTAAPAGTTSISVNAPTAGVAGPGPGPMPLAPSRTATSRDASRAIPLYREADQKVAGVSEMQVVRSKAKRLEQIDAAIPGLPFGDAIDEGRGPGIAGDRFDPITDNPFKRVDEHAFSTFSVDVDTASYSKVRDFLVRARQLPRPDAVRIEEMLNYFDYDYTPPANDAEHPFTAHTVVTGCPWNDNHRLARIALKGKTMNKEERPPCNLVFLLDTSGSMDAPNKLPLVIEGMKMLLKQLDDDDKVAIAVYAGSAGLVLDSTPGKKTKKIRKALTQLSAGGSTNGGAGIALAYRTARENFIEEGVNRVILCTDGDFNVGTTGTDELVRMVEQEAKGGVFLSVLGFGMGNHNDAMLEQVSGRGNGNYAFIDTPLEARKVLVEQTSGTLVTIAKDVKVQIEFNPLHVSSYRLIGYENRVLAKEDFNDDKKDAGEIGAGHTVTALYELVPAGVEADASRPEVDELKYQSKPELTDAANSNELMTLKLRYKQPDGDTSTLVEFPVVDDDLQFEQSDDDVRFAAAVAGFGMKLRRSEYAGNWTLSDVIETAQAAKGEDRSGLRSEFIELVKIASELSP